MTDEAHGILLRRMKLPDASQLSGDNCDDLNNLWLIATGIA